MSDTRRDFLLSAATAAFSAPAAGAADVAPSPASGAQPLAAKPLPPSRNPVPKMKFGKAEISRLVCGCNPFYGYSHFNQAFSSVMRDYYTPERVHDVWHRCNQVGVTALNYFPAPRAQQDLETFRQQGGAFHLVCQGMDDPVPMIQAVKPLAVYRHGGQTDKAFREDRMEDVREWCKKVRDLGVMVGVGSHNPTVIKQVEEQGWDVDFFACCVYNLTRTREELKETLHGEMVEMPTECYLATDPPRMYQVIRASRKPCFAFKVLAAGRVANVEQAFRTAYENIKPTDGVFVGLFPRTKDEVRENADRVTRLLRKG
jgi:hypothetical protein